MTSNNVIQFPKTNMVVPEAKLRQRNEEIRQHAERQMVINAILGPAFSGLTNYLYENSFKFNDEEQFKNYNIMFELITAVIYHQEGIEHPYDDIAQKLGKLLQEGRKFILEGVKEEE